MGYQAGEMMDICIVTPQKDAVSETFIRRHIEHLPAKVHCLYGGTFPVYSEGDLPLMALPLAGRIKRVLRKKIFNLSEQILQEEALRRFLVQNRIKAVLAEYGPTGCAVLQACKTVRVPLIVHFHGYDAYEYIPLERFREGYTAMFQDAAAMVAVSRDMKEQLIKLGAPSEKIHINVYGIDTAMFYGSDPQSANPHFITVGRFVDKKAPQLTILAFARARESYPSARLIMIGDGPLKEACRQICVSLKISNAVDFLGNCSNARVAEIMRSARGFLQHSVRPENGDSEGTPVAILEAGASGLPVVSTRHAGIKDVIVHGETGFLVDEFDVEGMAEYIKNLCEDPALAQRLGRSARARIQSQYKAEDSLKNLYGIIERCVHG